MIIFSFYFFNRHLAKCNLTGNFDEWLNNYANKHESKVHSERRERVNHHSVGDNIPLVFA